MTIFRFTHYDGDPRFASACEVLIRVDQIAMMPNFRQAATVTPEERTRWVGTVVLLSGHEMELCADLEQWNALAEAVLATYT